MFKRLLVFLVILGGLAVLADRGLAYAAGNATGDQIKLHEGLREDVDVTFRGFPFVTQAFRGRFENVDVTARDVERNGIVLDRVDAHLEGVEVNMSKALKGRVTAVPVRQGTATVRLTYGDIGSWLASKPGNVHLVVRAGHVYVVSSFGLPGVGQVDVEGTPSVSVTGTTLRVAVSDVRVIAGGATLTASLASTAAARASFTIPMSGLPFGIRLTSAKLTDTALIATATATGFVIDVRDNA